MPLAVAGFRGGEGTRTPVEILAHIGDLMDWALSVAKGAESWHASQPLDWNQEVDRFFEALGAFDGYLASSEPLQATSARLFQGPVADALTHVGRLQCLVAWPELR